MKASNDAQIIEQAIAQTSPITPDYILTGIKAIADNPETKDADKLRALELLGRTRSLFKETATEQDKPVTSLQSQSDIDNEFNALARARRTSLEFTEPMPQADTIIIDSDSPPSLPPTGGSPIES